MLFGTPLSGTVATGRTTLAGAGTTPLGTAVNFGAVYVTALSSNAADDIEYGAAGFSAGTGVPLSKGVRTPVLVRDLAALDLRGTAGGVVAWEGYR